jgi:type IV secretory pathway VirB10-like protein
LGTCELASTDDKKCVITSGAVGVGLALVAGAALWLGSEDEPTPTQSPPPKIDWTKVPDTTPKQPTKAPPPPPDAGAPAVVPDAAAPVPADAGAPVDGP